MGDGIPALLLELLLDLSPCRYRSNLNLPTSGSQKRRAKHSPLRAYNHLLIAGQGPLAERAGRRMRNDELLVTTFAGTRLRMELDRIPLWRGDHVEVRQLVDDFARYSYLPRLKDPSVLLESIRNGLALMTWEQGSFAYADGYDDSAGRYRGLQSGPRGALADNDPGLVVHPQVARRQMDLETASPATPTQGGGTTYVQEPSGGGEVRLVLPRGSYALRAPTPKDGGGEAECLGGRQRAGMYVDGQQPRSRCGCAATTGGSQ